MLFLLKILITPLLTAVITFIERRFGPHIAGVLIGLPLTSGPISLFLATEQGTKFSSNAALGTITGIIACGAFCVAYALCARHCGWLWSLVVALVAFSVVVVALPSELFGLGSMLVTAIIALSVSWLAVNRITSKEIRADRSSTKNDPPAWNLAARMLIATASIFFVTSASSRLGAQVSGVMSSIPILSAVLIGFSHAREGRAAATVLIRGLLGGCFPALAFFATIGALQHTSNSIASTYTMATAVTLVLCAIVGWFTQPQLPGAERR